MPGDSLDPPLVDLTRRRIATAAVMCGMFASAIEMTIVGTAMPRIAGALGGSDRFAWVISVYLVTSAVAAPLAGKLSDLFGRKPAYLGGMSLFLVGSALSGAAPSMTLLIIARATQGLGGGALATVPLTIVGDLYTPIERGRIQGVFSAVWGVAGALGPLAGGLIVDHLNWRWVFYINLPVGGLAMVLAWISLRERVVKRRVRLDFVGALVLTAAIALIQFAGGGHSANASHRGLLAVPGVALLGVFLWVESRVAAPILPLALLRNRVIGTGLLASLLTGAVMFGVVVYLPLFIQGVEGGSAGSAGAVMTPLLVAWPVAGVIAGLLIARFDPRAMVRVGMTLVAIGAAIPMWISPGGPRAVIMAAGLVVGAGMGTISTPILIAVQTAVPWETRGVATAGFQFSRTIGGTLGVIVLSAFVERRLSALRVAPDTVDALLRPGAALGSATARAALADGLHQGFAALAVFGAASWLAALAFPRGTVALDRNGDSPAAADAPGAMH